MSRKKGFYYEQHAKHYLSNLIKEPHRILEENFTCRMGEIDLITECPNTQSLHFIEVKYRKNAYFSHPLESITYSKKQKLIKTASYYLQTHPQLQHIQTQFDVICILGIPPNTLEWFPNAF